LSFIETHPNQINRLATTFVLASLAAAQGIASVHPLGEGRLKSGFGGLHIESNHRLM